MDSRVSMSTLNGFILHLHAGQQQYKRKALWCVHDNNRYANRPWYYVIRTLPIYINSATCFGPSILRQLLHWKDVARGPDLVSTWGHRACFPFPGTECRSPSLQAVTVMTDKWRHYDTLSTPDETCLCACEGYKLIGCDVLLFIHPPSPTRSTQICM